ncbi:MAG: NAD(P)H-dependent oxidoreductase [Methanobrevibacter sp.]|nr:NAD(P)H-dependent oxidoreductase [Methanobrevibacter sp.]
MKVHIVYCHPSNESVTYALKESYIEGLKASNIDFTISDLCTKKSLIQICLKKNTFVKQIIMNLIFLQMF